MIYYFNQEINEILTQLKTNSTTGLTTEEFKKRLEEHGYNQLVSKRRKTFFIILIFV